MINFVANIKNNIAKMRNNQIQNTCANNHFNQPILLVVLNDQLLPSQKLLCQLCIEELSYMPPTQSFKKFQEKIELEQDKLSKQFNYLITNTIESINLFKKSIVDLQKKLNTTFQEILLSSELWINNLQENQKQGVNNFKLSDLDQKLEEKQIRLFNEVLNFNCTYYKVIESTLSHNTIVKDILESQNVLKDILINSEKNFLNNSENNKSMVKIECQRQQNIPLLKGECLAHECNFTYINPAKGVKSNDRLKCIYCEKSNTIPFDEFAIKLQTYDQQQKCNIEKCKQEQIATYEKLTESLQTIMITQCQQINELLSEIEQAWICSQKGYFTNQGSTNRVITVEQIEQVVEELRLWEESKLTQEELTFNQNNEHLKSIIKTKLQCMINSLVEFQNGISINQTQIKVEESQVEATEQNSLDEYNSSFKKLFYQQVGKVDQQENCCAISFNNDGSLMVAGCGNSVQVWQVEKRRFKEPLWILQGHTQEIFCFAFSKKLNWFASGSKDCTIRTWKENNHRLWEGQSSKKMHQKAVQCMLLNKKEDELISSSKDGSIKIWELYQQNNIMCFEYSLDKHTSSVCQISLNDSETQLVSCSSDKQIIIWGRDNNKQWRFMYQIEKSQDDYGYRVCFLNDATIAWKQYRQGFVHIFSSPNGQFREKSELKLELTVSQDSGTTLFPFIYNKLRQILVAKHGQLIYIMKFCNGKLKVCSQPINCGCDYNYGALTENGELLVIWNYETKNFLIYEINYDYY